MSFPPPINALEGGNDVGGGVIRPKVGGYPSLNHPKSAVPVFDQQGL